VERNGRINQLAAKLANALERAFLVNPDQSGIAATSAARNAASLRGALISRSPRLRPTQYITISQLFSASARQAAGESAFV
jgi:hypothetical protein